MNIPDYIPAALAFENKVVPMITCAVDPALKWGRLNHAALGLSSEVIEFYQATDAINQAEEMGDIAWFAALAYDALGRGPIECTERYDKKLIFALCGEFTSRVKSALYYGKARKDTDVGDWRDVPYRILRQISLMNEANAIDIFAINIRKLQARYPEKFVAEKAQNRDLVNERLEMGKALVSGKTPTFVVQDTKTGQPIIDQ